MIEKNAIIEDRDVNVPMTALEFFLSMPDNLILDVIKYDPEDTKIMCLALSLELNGIISKKENSEIFLEN